MKFKPSKLQQAIYDWIEFGHGSAIVEAVAGSGKTTTIVNSLSYIPSHLQVIFLAFNKAIAEELTARVPDFVLCRTLNATGMKALMRHLSAGRGRARVTIDTKKTKNIMQFQGILHDLTEIAKLVALGKSYGVAPRNSDYKGVTPDTDDFWLYLMDRYDMDIPDYRKPAIIDHVVNVLLASLQERHVIDFDDQLYMSVLLDAHFDRYDWVFVDEAQDVSPIQRAMLKKILKPGGRLVAVGDPCQAIYGFRGADSSSLDNIASEFNAVRLPLSMSYRCPRKVVEYAQKVVSHIEASPTAIEGEVTTWSEYTGQEFNTKDMIICRNTAPLVKLAYGLIARQVPARVIGRDIGANLVKLIEKLKPKGIEGKDGLLEKLEAWREKESEKAIRDDKEELIQGIDDKYETLTAFIDGARASTVPKLKEAIENLFGEAGGGVVQLCTVHKSKGLEAKRVFVLNDYLMPSKFARQEWQKAQENNLRYVAYTRAQETLVFIDDTGLVDKKRVDDLNKQIDMLSESA